MDKDLVEIGRIHGPHGLKGKIRITPFGDSFERFRGYTHLIIGRDGTPVRVTSSEQKKGSYIVGLEGFDHIDQVEHLKGQIIYIQKEQLEDLQEGEYYWRDIIGLNVMDENGNMLGEVVEIFATGSNDVYVVDRVKQYLIPATKDVVKEISLENRTMTIDASLLEGLLD